MEELRRELRGWGLLGPEEAPTLQQKLTAVVLRPGNLLNIVRHYVFEKPVDEDSGDATGRRHRATEPKTVKVVCRHQQYRATEKIVARLRTRPSRRVAGGERDERGGVIWHTQGAGKSFTMQFLARRLHMSRDPELNGITIVAITDRTDLQRQLRRAVALSDSEIRQATSRTDLESLLRRAGRPGGRAVIFATIQKFLGDLAPGKGEGNDTADGQDRALAEDFEQARRRAEAGESAEEVADPTPDARTLSRAERIFPECSDEDRVLVLVDEAHRSHTSVLHACLRKALPNADQALARKALADWYSRVGQRWMRGRLQPWAARMDVPEPSVRVRDLGHRWGSFRAGAAGPGVISLHWATFQLPIHLVDYVVAHELAHVRVSGHGPDYWRLLGRALPECRRLKTELDELGRRVWMGDVGR
ncbi:YgjP-like metallopeptidase domain-containing protein [Streptomyces europaeiscabiei]|uniref:YgjP-like metallopeptidase domain-containing protein n=1 Tax=Streptomyces europaeiscabiei TaxID=146819 RepID=UPI002E0F807E|nr:DUF45 domain-containing protein [Streptomyces europaeiscabiei]